MRDVFAERDCQRSRLTVSDFLVTTLLQLFVDISCVLMQRSHVTPVSGEFFDVDRVSEVPKIREMHFGILEVVIRMP